MASKDLLGDDQITMNDIDLKGWMSKKVFVSRLLRCRC